MTIEGSSTEARGQPPAGGAGADRSARPADTPLIRGRYEPGERIAEGGFFTVVRARDALTGRPVALKTLNAEFSADAEFMRRLRDEAEAAIRLEHPEIAQVYEVWEDGGTLHLATELVRGINLKERIRRFAPFPLAVAIDIAAAVAEALQAAADAGFVHGDVRPENVIVTPEGHVKVTDFGVGRAIAASSRIQVTALLRSARYLSPEVAQGRPLEPAADVYSLGILIYEMLAGQPPFDGDTPVAIAVKHLHDPPPSLRRQNAGVPKAAETVVAKCLQKDPALRYPSAGALLADLRGVREALRFGRSLDTVPPPASVKAARASVPPRPEASPPGQQPVPRAEEMPPRMPPPVSAPASEPSARKRRERQRDDGGGEPSSWLLVLGLFFAILLLVGGFAFMSWIFRAPRDIMVPPVLQLSQVDAEGRLKAVGLPMVVERQEYDEKNPAGTVLRVIPPGGTSVKEGRPVRVWISKGPAPIEVPDVTGKPLKNARGEIRSLGLVVGGIADEFNETVEKGEVISQKPRAGESVPRRTAVSLVVSKGPEPPPEPAPTPEPVIPEGDPNTPVQDRLFDISLTVPKGTDPQEVRIEVVDVSGAHDVVNEQHSPGDALRYSVPARGRKGGVIIRVYLDGRLFTEQYK
jgi:eukaryotic-like serine/threonine-protein kinase